MYTKAIALLAIVASVSAGVVYDSPHVGAQSEQTVRNVGLFGSQTVSHQSKAVDSAFSSVRRSESRVYNPSVTAVASPVYAQQAVYAQQPAYAYQAAPVAYAHAAPVARVASPVATLIGSRYSPALAYNTYPGAAHLFFDGFGAHYEY